MNPYLKNVEALYETTAAELREENARLKRQLAKALEALASEHYNYCPSALSLKNSFSLCRNKQEITRGACELCFRQALEGVE